MNKKGFIEDYEKALHGVWSSPKMIDYCVKKVDNVVKLDNGFLIAIDKESIKKDFCFGYSLSRYDSEDFDRANEMARYAGESENYFYNENMKHFRSLYDDLTYGEYHPAVCTQYYLNDESGAVIKSLAFLKGWEVCEMFGGSCYMDKVGGTTGTARGREYYILTKDDIAKVVAGVELAMKNHEKRVNTYLKKYGTKHVNSWSYWQDA